MSVTLPAVVAFVRFQYPTEDAYQHIADKINVPDKQALTDVEALEYYMGQIAADNNLMQLFDTLQSSSASAAHTITSVDPYTDIESVRGSDEEEEPEPMKSQPSIQARLLSTPLLHSSSSSSTIPKTPLPRYKQVQTGSWFVLPPKAVREQESEKFLESIQQLLNKR